MTHTVLDHLEQQRIQTPDRVLYTFVDDAGRDQESLTCRQLAHGAYGIAAALVQQHGLQRGDRVLLSYPQSLDFIKALLGCMIAGIIPVPVYPPNPLNPGRSVALFGTLAAQCHARAILTNGEYNRLRRIANVTERVKGVFQRHRTDWPQLPWMRTDQMAASSEAPAPLDPSIGPEDIAFLQFTSGSTSVPKGVAITYGNIESQLAAVAQPLYMDAQTRGVLWVPQYHDLGLINGIFNAIFIGGHLTLMSPLTFLKRPDLWFEVMSRVRATHTAAPNFAYDLAIRKTTSEQRRRWDLSALKIMMLAAEPVQPTTIERFFAAFAESGIPRSCCCPGYGLAEHTVGIAVYGQEIVDFDRHALEQEKVARPIVAPIVANETPGAHAAIRLVGCGRPIDGVRVRIVHPDTHIRCAEQHVGEIWVDSPSKAAGYDGLPEQTAETFHARIAGEHDPTAYLRTGDLGFFYKGELFVVGRIKDLIIVRGRNIYPQDIEETIRECHPLIRPGGVVAFSVPDHPAHMEQRAGVKREDRNREHEPEAYEQLVVMVEVREGRPNEAACRAIAETVQQTIAREHQLRCHAIVIVQRGALLKTTSGKIQRQACRQAFLEETFASKTLYRHDTESSSVADQTLALSDAAIHNGTTEAETESPEQLTASSTPTVVNTSTPPTDAAQPQSMYHQLQRLSPAAQQAALTTYLQRVTAQAVGFSSAEQIDTRHPLLSLGLDSLKSIELIHTIESDLQISLPLTALIDASIEELATQLLTELDTTVRFASLPPLLPAPTQRHEPFPLTDLQHAFWVGQSGEFDLSAGYHGYLELDCAALDSAQLQRSWQQLIERHEMLRAVVLPTGEQQILPSVPAYQIRTLDLTAQDGTERQQRLQAIRDELSHQRFVLTEWPLFDIRITRITAQQTRLHISLAGIMLDGASLFHLLHEWQTLYRHPTTTLPSLAFSYRDYVLWLESLRETKLYQQARTYWLKRLETLPAAPSLPLKTEASTPQRPHFVRRTHRLTAAQWEALQQQAHAANVTGSVILLTAFAKVLATWSTASTFTLNLTLFNRPPIHPQINALVGDFSTITLLEVDQSTPLSFVQHAQQLHRQLWTDLAHRAFGGVEVLRALGRHHAQPDQRPLMPVVFTSMLPLTTDDSTVTMNDLFGGKVVDSITQTPQVYLDHQVMEEHGALLLHWDAVDDIFPSGLLDVMFDTYCAFLERLATDETAWSAVIHSLVPKAQLARRATLNETAAPIPDARLETLFLQQVAVRGNEPALLSLSQTLTYAELQTLATNLGNQVRGALAQQGHQTETSPVVAVVMEKGWEQIVGVLGTLFAGAAYLPIDADTPPERLQYLLQDGGVTVALTQSWVEQQLSWPDNVERIAVDKLPPANQMQPTPQPEATRTQGDLAAIIYTSGSTGAPKGVMLSHRGLVNAIAATNQRFAVGPADRVLALTPLIHDMSLYDIFGTLAAGGTIVMPDAAQKLDSGHWLNLIQCFQVTIWNSVPAMLEMLLDAITDDSTQVLTSLRLAFLGGDWIGLSLPTRLQALAEQIQVVSVGGPTETTLWNIWYPIDDVDPTWPSIPYGKPIANTRYYVLNEALAECPDWVPGQLYVGGVGLAAGYWRDAERTAEKFIHHPITGERLYATGDLGRYHPFVENGRGFQTGNIEFLGRVDNQLKVRGRRIEPGEIEALLQRHPLISRAVVTAVGERNHQRLVAHVVRHDNGTSAAADQLFEAVDFNRVEGIRVQNPIDRIDFKLGQKGIRREQAHGTEIQLTRPAFDDALRQSYLSRQSYRHFSTEVIPFAQFSRFISCLMQHSLDGLPLPKYRYPSGGGLYPVQCYLSMRANRIEGVAGGFYYYHPREHRLVPLNTAIDGLATIHSPTNGELYAQSAFSLYLFADMDAIRPMYGTLSHELCLLEAGYMGQLLMNEAPEHMLGLCPIGALELTELHELLKLGEQHCFLHSLVGGRIEPAQRKQWLVGAPGGTRNKDSDAWQETLRRYLAEQLPAYMVPSTFVAHAALPLTANGKVDRRALSRTEIATASTKVYVAPRTPLEAQVAALWTAILNRPQVGIHDDFFELGGDSLSVTRLLTQLRTTYEVEFPLRALFDHPTVASFADYLETMRQAQLILPAGAAGVEEEEGTI